MGTDNTYPYHFLNAAGAADGMIAEVISEAAKRSRIRLKWVARLEGPAKALQANAVDIWPLLSVQKALWPELHFTRPYLRNSYIALFARPEFESRAELARVRRVAVVNYPLVRKLAQESVPGAEMSLQPSREEALSAVCRGESDLAFMEARAAQFLMLHRPRDCGAQQLHSSGMDVKPTALGLASTPAAARAADRLRDEIDRMLADGTMQQLMLRWNYYYSGEAEVLWNEEEASRANSISWALACVLGLAALVLLRLLWRMQEARQEAQQASAAKTQFLSTMSHEIRTPLHGLLGMSELLRETNLAPDQREYAELIEQSGRALLELVNDVLDLARVERGHVELQLASYDPPSLFAASLKFWEGQAKKKGIELLAEGWDTLPAHALGDEAKVRQVLANLLSNAVKFTSSGSVTLRAGMRGDGQSRTARIEVADTGIGIAPESLSSVFEQFRQANHTIARHYGGTGLGLSIARKLVEMMGGEIGLTSDVGVGTCFWFTLPMKIPPAVIHSAPADTPRSYPAPGLPPGHIPAVLLAEDNAVNQRIAQKLLARAGCQVTTVADGQAALEALKTQQFAAVFMDCQMPLMNGFEATAQIRNSSQDFRSVPVIALTASAMAGEKQKCIEAGMDDYLTKPMDLAELDRVLHRWVLPEQPETR
jgi:signal transduction histidine kinase/ActR/RegA family two-component response regulator